jgi:hypothetical protein
MSYLLSLIKCLAQINLRYVLLVQWLWPSWPGCQTINSLELEFTKTIRKGAHMENSGTYKYYVWSENRKDVRGEIKGCKVTYLRHILTAS